MKEIREYLKVDSTSKTGLRWIKSPSRRVKAGDEAFTRIDSAGYYGGGFNYKTYSTHRVIMYLTENKWSSRTTHIDHIDGNKLNNNRSNLRFVPPTGNQRNANRVLNINNKTGIKGLEKVFTYGKFRWRARHAGITLYTGLKKELAITRLKEARANDSQYMQ